MTYYPTAKSYFSGCGGLDYGFASTGVNITQSLEIDKHACTTLEQNFKHKVLRRDIKDITVLMQDKTDLILGTYPCNHYSTIADLYGTRTGDDLFLHFFRHIALERPEMYIVENVPGMKKFPVVMEAMSKLPDYYVQIFCPTDALNWLPQKRQRLILIGSKRRFPIQAPEFKPSVRLQNILEKDPEIKTPKSLVSRMAGKYRDLPIISDPVTPGVYAPTCVAHYSKDQSTRVVKDRNSPIGVRPYTIREYARLQGFPDSFWFPSTVEAYKQIGNAVAVPMAQYFAKQVIKYFN